jgi:hypothetical protein
MKPPLRGHNVPSPDVRLLNASPKLRVPAVGRHQKITAVSLGPQVLRKVTDLRATSPAYSGVLAALRIYWRTAGLVSPIHSFVASGR